MLNKDTQKIKNKNWDFDVLNDVLDTLRFRGSIFFHSTLAAPWGLSLATMASPRFHIALEGGFYIGVSNKNINVKPMDIVMLPHGDMHWIADEIDRDLVSSEQADTACELGNPLFQEGEITNRVMCGLVEYDEAISHPLISALPSVFHLCDIQDDDSIWMTVKLIDAEIIRSHTRQNSIIDRLTEVLFIKLLNQYIEKNEHLAGFLSALQEPRLKKVLQLIHQNPEEPWSLEIISDTVGMSRATLLRKFKAALGVSPMTYISRWRMAKAYQLLSQTSLSMNGIADAIGFANARTFRTAFQRHYGITPSSLRNR